MATRLADEICPDRTDCRCAEAKGIQCVLRHDEKENFSDIVLGLHGIEVGGKPCVSGRGKAGGGTFLP